MIVILFIFLVALYAILMNMKHHRNHHGSESGSLTITGHGIHRIHLHYHPKEIDIGFCDEEQNAACDIPNDHLVWRIENLQGNPCIEIEWKIGGVREIKWLLKY